MKEKAVFMAIQQKIEIFWYMVAKRTKTALK